MIEKSTILYVQYYMSRVCRLTDFRLVSRWVRSNDAKRTGKPTQEKISPKAEERERKKFIIKSMSNRVNRVASSRSSHYRWYGIGSWYAHRGNVVTGNGIILRCSPDGRTNVRVLLFQLCRLHVFPLYLFHLRLALSYNPRHTSGSVLPFTSIDPISFFFRARFSLPFLRVNEWINNK